MRSALALCCLSILSVSAVAEETNLRLGVGMLRYDIDPGAEYMPKFKDTGTTLMAEFPQDNLHGSRFIIYSQNDGESDIWGFETQMLLGYGLEKPGARIYTGPTWYREVMRTRSNGVNDPRVFNGWGWQFGLGWQYQRVTLDLASTFRMAKDYQDENQRADLDDTGSPQVALSNLLISYQF